MFVSIAAGVPMDAIEAVATPASGRTIDRAAAVESEPLPEAPAVVHCNSPALVDPTNYW